MKNNFKGQQLQIFKNLQKAIYIVNDMECGSEQGKRQPYCRILVPPGHKDVSGSQVSCLNQFKCDILVRSESFQFRSIKLLIQFFAFE